MQDQIDSLTAKVDGLFAALGAICAVAGVPVMERPGRQLSGTSGWCFRCPAEWLHRWAQFALLRGAERDSWRALDTSQS
jgi:hypothetical protein